MDRRRFLLGAAAVPFLVRAGAASALSTHALVTCDAESRLAAVDLGAREIVGSIATPADPRAIERVGDRLAVVCHTAASAVSIVDRRRLLHVLHGFVEPRYAAAHPDGEHAFVTDSGDASLFTVAVTTGRIVGRVKLDEWPRHVTIDRSGRKLWVGLGSAAARVAIVDVSQPRRPRLLAHVPTPFLSHDVAFSPDGRVWVTSGASPTTAIFDVRGALPDERPAGAAPQHVTFGAGRAYVTSGDDGTLAIHTLDGRLLRQVAIPTGSYNVQYGGGFVVTPSLDRGTLAVLDRAGGVPAVVHVAGSCHDACVL